MKFVVPPPTPLRSTHRSCGRPASRVDFGFLMELEAGEGEGEGPAAAAAAETAAAEQQQQQQQLDTPSKDQGMVSWIGRTHVVELVKRAVP